MGFQTGGSILDFIVLAILHKNDEYGYLLTQQVREILDISETAMYPALKRLQKAHLLATYDLPCQGRNRRYYKLTDEGQKALSLYTENWNNFQENVYELLQKENNDKS